MKKGKHIESSKSDIWMIGLVIAAISIFAIVIVVLVTSIHWKSADKKEVFNSKGSHTDFFEGYHSNEVTAYANFDSVMEKSSKSISVFNDESLKKLTFTSYDDDIFRYKTKSNYLALTFDDCPSGDMQMIFDLLEEYDMRCTFYMIGSYMEYDKGWAKEAVRRGHTVANHSYNHPNFKYLSSRNIKSQLDKTSKLIEQETGIKPIMFRPPYGSYNDEVKKISNEYGYTIAMWNVDSLDWKDIDHAYDRAAKAKKGDVVLFHTLHATKSGLRWLLEDYTSRGLKSIPMEELIILEKLENDDTTSLKELGLELK